MKNNQKGFSTVETLLILIIVGLIGFIGWYIWDSKKEADSSPSAAVQVTKTSSSSAKNNLNKTYTDSKDKTQFNYPSSWKLDIEKQDDFGTGYASGTLTSPSGKVELAYANYVTGVGGGTCPEVFPCPTVHILKIEDVPGANNLKYIEKITDWKGNGDGFTPSFGLSNAETADEWKVGAKKENDFYLFANFSEDGGLFAYQYTPSARPEAGFKSYQEAVAFLNSKEAKVAKQILLSTKTD